MGARGYCWSCPMVDSVARWGHGRARIVRSVGVTTLTVRPQRVRCRDCGATYVLLPTALQVRRADTTEVIGIVLAYTAKGLGFRSIGERMGRPESTGIDRAPLAAPDYW